MCSCTLYGIVEEPNNWFSLVTFHANSEKVTTLITLTGSIRADPDTWAQKF